MTTDPAPETEPDGQELSYEQARDELVSVVQRLENGGVGLEESLALWERGEHLAAVCPRAARPCRRTRRRRGRRGLTGIDRSAQESDARYCSSVARSTSLVTTAVVRCSGPSTSRE